jgi:dihydrofolate reductase
MFASIERTGFHKVRKIYVFMSLSLDGCFEGRDHDLSWHNVDDEFNKYAVGLLSDTDLFLYGRRTYELMESFWPGAADDATMSQDNLEIARLLNHTPKIVYSRTLERVEEKKNWTNVRLENDFDPATIRRLKNEPGKAIGAGGSELAVTLLRAALIDECIFMMTPVVVGAGTPIFKGLDRSLELELIGSRTFKSGNVMLQYRPVYGAT